VSSRESSLREGRVILSLAWRGRNFIILQTTYHGADGDALPEKRMGWFEGGKKGKEKLSRPGKKAAFTGRKVKLQIKGPTFLFLKRERALLCLGDRVGPAVVSRRPFISAERGRGEFSFPKDTRDSSLS